MSSFKNAAKSNQKTHRERSQLTSRAHLGMLEKKKDYKKRATEYHKKQNALKLLRRKALDKNPDEFYFKMINSRMQDGVHQSARKVAEYTEDQLKLMQTQDIKYIKYKRNIERKKIEKLKGCLHFIGEEATAKKPNSHIIFVDSKKEAKQFDAAKHFNTDPALLSQTYNRPTIDKLKTEKFLQDVDDETLKKIFNERTRMYKELTKRIERENQLRIVEEKLQLKKNLMDKSVKCKKVKPETVHSTAIYKWEQCRKR
ncbi:putative U3 small nucleolar RNA-associated protein 11 [Tubulanus polymorphus]|uniref:putative U3 small nucleolar RNA-associated protein 11 n=1 Tax=Tubulanus polymorphus TaxID=672921 RepID=UPI003DA226EF